MRSDHQRVYLTRHPQRPRLPFSELLTVPFAAVLDLFSSSLHIRPDRTRLPLCRHFPDELLALHHLRFPLRRFLTLTLFDLQPQRAQTL